MGDVLTNFFYFFHFYNNISYAKNNDIYTQQADYINTNYHHVAYQIYQLIGGAEVYSGAIIQ